MGRVTDLAPAGLVPAAWLVTMGAHVGVVDDRTLLVGLTVMATLLVAFYAAGRTEMVGPVLDAWRLVVLVGIPVTAAGVVGLALSVSALAAVSLFGWMLLPAAGYALTSRAVRERPFRGVYVVAAGLTLVGTAGYAVGLSGLAGVVPGLLLAGLALVGLGQSAGVAAAAVQNS